MSDPSQSICIISGTDRADAYTFRIAAHCEHLLTERGAKHVLLDLRDLPRDLNAFGHYDTMTPAMSALITTYLDPAGKLLIVVPEYNGSFPGILKLFMDSVHPRHFMGRKAGLIGLSDGHAGNLRGLDHLTGILNYLRVDVLWNKPKLSAVETLFTGEELTDARAVKQLQDLADRLIAF